MGAPASKFNDCSSYTPPASCGGCNAFVIPAPWKPHLFCYGLPIRPLILQGYYNIVTQGYLIIPFFYIAVCTQTPIIVRVFHGVFVDALLSHTFIFLTSLSIRVVYL